MSIWVLIRNSSDELEPVSVLGGSPSMLFLLDMPARKIKKSYPEIYDKAFSSLEWSEVHLENLDADQFKVVYEITRDAYEDFLEEFPSNVEPDPVVGPRLMWQEYMAALEGDPRLGDGARH
jgi:hypothetical protein